MSEVYDPTVKDDDWWGRPGAPIPDDYRDIHPDLNALKKSSSLKFFLAVIAIVFLPMSGCSLLIAYTDNDYSLAIPLLVVIGIIALVLASVKTNTYACRYATWIYRHMAPEKVKVSVGAEPLIRKYSWNRQYFNYVFNFPERHPREYGCNAISKDGKAENLFTENPAYHGGEVELNVYFDPVNKLAIVAEDSNGYRFWLEPRFRPIYPPAQIGKPIG